MPVTVILPFNILLCYSCTSKKPTLRRLRILQLEILAPNKQTDTEGRTSRFKGQVHPPRGKHIPTENVHTVCTPSDGPLGDIRYLLTIPFSLAGRKKPMFLKRKEHSGLRSVVVTGETHNDKRLFPSCVHQPISIFLGCLRSTARKRNHLQFNDFPEHD